MDRRLIACCLTFGLTSTYMLLPVGFGNIFLIEILAKNLNDNGLLINGASMPLAMIIPVSGMLLGLLVAIFWSYRKPKSYAETSGLDTTGEKNHHFNTSSDGRWPVLLPSRLPHSFTPAP